jgi:hypothetical protein
MDNQYRALLAARFSEEPNRRREHPHPDHRHELMNV